MLFAFGSSVLCRFPPPTIAVRSTSSACANQEEINLVANDLTYIFQLSVMLLLEYGVSTDHGVHEMCWYYLKLLRQDA